MNIPTKEELIECQHILGYLLNNLTIDFQIRGDNMDKHEAVNNIKKRMSLITAMRLILKQTEEVSS